MSDNELNRLVYASRMRPFVSKPDIRKIQESAVDNNNRNGLTGVLLCGSRTFIQMLEGPRPLINETFARILRDGRHSHVRVLCDEPATKRFFPSWSMGVIRLPDVATQNNDESETAPFEQPTEALSELQAAVASGAVDNETAHVAHLLQRVLDLEVDQQSEAA